MSLIVPASLERMDRFLADRWAETPYLVIDLETIRARLAVLRAALPAARVHYAVRANPAIPVITALNQSGISFDIAGAGEIDRCLDAGVDPGRLCFGATVKRDRDIARAGALGVDLFAFDKAEELEKIARFAPGAGVYCRFSSHDPWADGSRPPRFGCSAHRAAGLLIRARDMGLRPEGVAFSVGCQQTDPTVWTDAIRDAASVFRACARAGVELTLLHLGHGLPARYRESVPPLEAFAEAIAAAVRAEFGTSAPALVIEPGRWLTADAGILRVRVLLVSRDEDHDRARWVYLDGGCQAGLAAGRGSGVYYQIRTSRDGGACAPAVLAGAGGEGDIIDDGAHYSLPVDLCAGDTIDFLGAGAYTAGDPALGISGIAPSHTWCI